jgi:hypothetical protein
MPAPQTRSTRTLAAALALACLALPAPAQSQPRAPAPGLTGGADWEGEDRPRVLPEGVFLVGRQGRLIAGPRGYRVFVPNLAGRQPGEGPMLVAPNQTLARAVAAFGTDTEIVVSGQVLLYHGRNYLLPSAIARASVATRPGPAGQGTDDAGTPAPLPARPAPAPTAASAEDDPEVAALFEELSDERLAPRFMPPPPSETAAQAAPSEGQAPALTEGSTLSRRQGRLVRMAGGEWAVTFDNDPDSAAAAGGAEEPLTVLPCRALMDLERRVMRAGGEGTPVLVSGRVYSYGARRYLLPTIVQFQPDLGLAPQQ